MRQLLMGTALLLSALVVTFATASVLQGMATQKRTIVAEPFQADRITPTVTATRPARTEPLGGRMALARRAEM